MPEQLEKATGKIFKLSNEGWGFITSKDIEFERIFFYWDALTADTLKFKELCKGMIVEFKPVQVTFNEGKNHGWRAIKVKVIDDKGLQANTKTN